MHVAPGLPVFGELDATFVVASHQHSTGRHGFVAAEIECVGGHPAPNTGIGRGVDCRAGDEKPRAVVAGDTPSAGRARQGSIAPAETISGGQDSTAIAGDNKQAVGKRNGAQCRCDRGGRERPRDGVGRTINLTKLADGNKSSGPVGETE